MKQAMNRRQVLFVLAGCIAICAAAFAQNQKPDYKIDPAVLAQAPNVPQMVVDSDGTVHFGPRTVPVPALVSPEAKQVYTNQMLEQATSLGGARRSRIRRCCSCARDSGIGNHWTAHRARQASSA